MALLENSNLSIIVTVADGKEHTHNVFDICQDKEADKYINDTIQNAKKEQSKYDGIQILDFISADLVRFSINGDHSMPDSSERFFIVEYLDYVDGSKI